MINALKPFVQAMNAALSGIIDFAEKVVNALGKIFGWVIEITPSDMAIDDAMIDVLDDQTSGLEDVADAADDAAKSIEKAKEEEEEYQRTVLGFDELNKLNAEKEKKEDEPGASNKGNSAVGNPLKNLDLSKASAGAGDVKMSVKKIKSLYESEIDTLYDLGRYISETLTKALNGIQWDKVYEGARGFGKGLASFLNGLITPDLFGALGRTIANSLNTALQFLNSFGKEFDFKNFGNALKAGLDALLANFNWNLAKDTARTWAKGMADGLNEFINPETFAALGRTIAEGINTALDFLDEFSRDFDFKNLGDSIENGLIALLGTIDWKTAYSAADGFGTGLADFLNELITPNLFDEVGKTVASVMNTALHFLDSFGETFKWEKFGTSLATGVNTFLDTFDWKLLGTSINTWVNGVFDAIESFLATIHWETLFDGVKTTLSQISFASIGTSIIGTLWAGLGGGSMPEETRQKILTSLSGLETTLRNIAGFTFGTLSDFYSKFLVPVGEWALGTGLPKLADILKHTLEKISWDKLKTGLDGIYQILAKFTTGVGDGFLTFFEGVSNFPGLSTLINALGEGLSTLFASGMTDQEASKIHDVGEALGFALGAIVSAKLTVSVANAIKKLASNESLPALATALSTHPAATLIAGGAALAASLTGLYLAANKPQVDENIANTAQAIKDLGDELAATDIKEDSNYKRILEILDKYWELNQKLLETGSLTPEEQSMFEWYAGELEQYSEGIITKTTNIGDAYKGSKDELVKWLEAQREQIRTSAYEEYLNNLYTEMAKQQIQLDLLNGSIDDNMEANAKAAIAAHDNELSQSGLYHEMLNLTDEQFGTLFDAYMNSLHGANDETVTGTELFKTFKDVMKEQGVQKTWDDYAVSVDAATESMKDAQEKIDTIEGRLYGMSETAGTTCTTITKSAEDTVDNVNKTIEVGGTTLNDTVKYSVTDPMETAVGGAAKVVQDAGKDAIEGMAEEMEGAAPDAQSTFETIMSDIKTKMSDAVTNAKEKGTDIVTKMKDGIDNTKDKVSTAFKDVMDGAKSTLNTKGDELVSDANDIGEGVINAYSGGGGGSGGGGKYGPRISFNSRMSMIDKNYREYAKSGADAMRDFLGIVGGGPSSIMDAIGNSTIGGFLKGATDKIPDVKSEFESLPGKLKDKMGNVFNFFKPSGEDTIEGMQKGESDTVGTLETVFAKLPTQLGNQMSEMKSTFESIGKNIPTYIKDGVKATSQSLLTAVSDMEVSMRGQFTQAVYDSWWRIGHDLMQTLVNGINSVRPHIPVPHFDVITGYSGTTPYPIVRNLGWYAKGGLAYDASVIGVGEAGNEAVIPLENPGVMQAIAEAIVTAMPDAVTRGMVAANVGNDNRPIVVNATLRTENNEVLARAVAQGQRQIDYRQNAVARF